MIYVVFAEVIVDTVTVDDLLGGQLTKRTANSLHAQHLQVDILMTEAEDEQKQRRVELLKQGVPFLVLEIAEVLLLVCVSCEVLKVGSCSARWAHSRWFSLNYCSPLSSSYRSDFSSSNLVVNSLSDFSVSRSQAGRGSHCFTDFITKNSSPSSYSEGVDSDDELPLSTSFSVVDSTAG